MDPRSPRMMILFIWLLPVAVCLPYAFFARDFRLLLWVWENRYWPFWAFFFGSMLASLLSTVLLFRLRQLGWAIYLVAAGLILAHGTFLAMLERRHFLLVLVFCEAAILLGISEWIRYVTKLPYYDSRRNWWESYPKPLPGTHVTIYAGPDKSRAQEARLSHLGREGCFVFFPQGPCAFPPRYIEIKGMGEAVLGCAVEPALYTRDCLGVGLRFIQRAHDGDWYKSVGEAVDRLRRAGYVTT